MEESPTFKARREYHERIRKGTADQPNKNTRGCAITVISVGIAAVGVVATWKGAV
jgi:hypothetical protein